MRNILNSHAKKVVNEILRLNNSKNHRISLAFESITNLLSLSLFHCILSILCAVFGRWECVCVCKTAILQFKKEEKQKLCVFIHLCLKRLISTIWGFLSRLGRLLCCLVFQINDYTIGCSYCSFALQPQKKLLSWKFILGRDANQN